VQQHWQNKVKGAATFSIDRLLTSSVIVPSNIMLSVAYADRRGI